MAKKQLVYTVRGLDKMSVFASPVGQIEAVPGFKEAAKADFISTFTFMLMQDLDMIKDQETPIVEVDLSIVLDTTDKLEVRALKSQLREVLKRWAEKCRVRGCRGFRTNAIRTPVFEYKNDCTLMNVKVLLSRAIVYSKSLKTNMKISDSFSDAIEDLELLVRQLRREIQILTEVRYRYTGFDNGILF